MEVISEETLNDTNTKDLAEALRYTAGVDYTPASGRRSEPSFYIRGFDEGQIGIFVDGIPMYSIYDKQTDWGQFVMFDASEIQVSKGYTSVLYGPNTLGGAVNLTTKKPTDKLEIELKAQYAFPAQHSEYVRVGTNLGFWYAQFSFSQILRDHYDLSNNFITNDTYQTTKHRVNSYYTNRRINAKVGITPNSTDEYSFNITYQMGDKGGLLSTVDRTQWWDWPHYDKITAYWASTTRFLDFITLDTRLYYDTFYNELVSKGNWRGGSTFSGGWLGSSIYDDFTIGGNIALGFEITSQDTLKLNASVKSDNHFSDNFDQNGIYEDSDINRDITSYGSVEYAHAFNKDIRLVLSGSYTHNDVTRAVMSSEEDKTYSLYGWGVQGILYINILDNLETYFTAGRKNNVPTLKDRYSETWGYRVANPNLQVESAINIEAGLNYYPIDSLKLSFAAFYNDLTDMIVTEDLDDSACSAGTECYRLVNEPSGYSVGFEVGLEYNLLSTLQLAANYSYTQRRARGGALFPDEIPHHLAKFRAKYNPIEDVDLVLGMRYTSSRVVSGASDYIDSPNVFLADIRVAYRPSFVDWIKGLELAFGIDNLFDRNYWYSYGYEQSGRVVYLEASYKW